MPSEITMPQLSDTMSEGTLVKWLKSEGDPVSAGEEIAEIETDKATMPMESFEDGVLAYLAVEPGAKVAVGEMLAVVALKGEEPADVKKQASSGASAKSAKSADGANGAEESASATAVAENPAPEKSETSTKPAPPATTSVPNTRASGVALRHSTGNGSDARVRISPLAKRIADDLGVDPATIEGSGPNGRIVEHDVREAAKGGARKKPAAAAAPSKPAGPPPMSLAPKIAAGEVEKSGMSKMRSVIAQRLSHSKQTIPHFYEAIDIDMENVEALRAQMNRALEADSVRLSVADYIGKAVATALTIHPVLNANFDGETITRFGDVNLGIAVALEDGLIVPVLRGVNRLSIRDIREQTVDLVGRARKLNLKQSEMSGATFSISSLGSQGIKHFSAIINPPEVGILAVGAAEKRAVVRDGQLVARSTMTVTLSCDHRVVDGATAAEFMQTLKTLLESPGMLFV